MSLSTRGVGRAPLLLVLCGPSNAGKTTFANRLCKSGHSFTVIGPDKIRERLRARFGDPEHEGEVWDIYESMKLEALSKGRNVVLDACHISRRARWHGLQGPNSGYRKVCVVFDLPLRMVRERCIKEKRVPVREVERMWRAFQKSKPTLKGLKAEGFDEVYFVTEHFAYAGQGLRVGAAASMKKEATLVSSRAVSPAHLPSASAFCAAFICGTLPAIRISLVRNHLYMSAELTHSAFRSSTACFRKSKSQMVRSAVSRLEVIAMQPRDAWLIEKIDEMKAQRKAAAFDRAARPKTHRERLHRFAANGLPTSLQFEKEVKACQ